MDKVKLLAFSPIKGFWRCECGDIDDYYKELECNVIDIVTRTVGGEAYDIICDDEGLLKEDPIVSAVTKEGHPMLVGNLIFARHNIIGETVSLTEEDIDRIKQHRALVTPDGFQLFWAVICDYPILSRVK